MSFNLLDSVSGLFNHDLVNKAASSLGESEGNIQKALQAAVPSVLTGFLEKAGTADGAQTLLALARQSADSGISGRLEEFFQNRVPDLAGMVASLLGGKLGNISDLIAGFSGIKASSASSLLSMVAPAALGRLGSYAFANNMGANEISALLASQKESILSAIPTGFNLASIAGAESLAGVGSKSSPLSAEPAAHTSHDALPEATRKNNWLAPAFWAIGIFVLLLYIFRSCGAEHIPSEAHEDTLKKEHTEILPAQPVRESLKVKLPDGTELDAYKGGIEDNLVAYLNSNEPVSKEKWFDFDDLNFETGSATITASSMKQVQNIAAVLKAFPKVKIKIGGYTDNTGDSLSNVKLSQERADAVSSKLKESGHGSQLEAAEGYGPTHFVAPNDNEANKKKNRRISINVREK